ncbi:MAG: efflux RND transporter permease subunit [Nannocystaceae bacterium]|nr:efflux RND transporter permease subunit [Nannocystaceae bacterium]
MSDAPHGDAPGRSAIAATAGADVAELARKMDFYRVTTSRPVAVLMVFLAVIVFGAFSIRLLPLNLMPDISYPKLTVRTEYPGAAPAEVEDNVSRPLEELLGVVTGLTRIESISRAGASDVVLEFAWDTDMDEASQDVLEKLDIVRPNLPDGVEQPLILRYDPTLDPVLTLSLSGGGERFEANTGERTEAGLKLLRRVADREVRRLLEPVEGVAAVKVKGGLEEQIHVELDEGQLRRTGISVKTITDRLAAENVNLAGGTMRDGKTRYLVRTVNEFTGEDDIGDIVIVRREGRDVRLRDLATVHAGWRDRDVITRVDGHEAVEIEVYKEAEANIVEMAARVRERIDAKVAPRLEQDYGVTVAVQADRSRFIESSITEVRDTATSGGALAVLILFLFLRDVRSTLIVGISIPVSVLMTFAPLQLFGVSLNIMSLGGLALGIGMLVDNSIVVLESIDRCRSEGDELVRATVRGTAEVGGAVVASTLTTVAVFFPMVFVEGIAGQMFGDLGLAVVFSLLASLAVALFLIPMLASRRRLADLAVELRHGEGAGDGAGPLRALGRAMARWNCIAELRASLGGVRRRPLTAILLPYVLVRFVLHLLFELLGKLLLLALVGAGTVIAAVVWLGSRVFMLAAKPVLWLFGKLIDGTERAYPAVIRACLRNRPTVYLAFAGSLGFLVWGMGRLDTELVPELHQGEFTVELGLPVGTPLQQTDVEVAPIETRLLDGVPHLHAVTATIGSERDNTDSAERGEHTARLRVDLEPTTPPTLLQAMREGGATAQAARIEGEARAAVRQALGELPDVRVNITRPTLFSFKPPVEVEVRGLELDELRRATEAVAQRLRTVEGLRDVESSIHPGSPEVHIVYDRDKLARAGLDIRTVAELVRDKVQGAEATSLRRRDRKVPIFVRLSNIREASVEDLRALVVNPGGARPIPLSAVADIAIGRGPNEIRRVGQQRVGLVTANVEGAGLGSITTRIADAVAELPLPAGVSTAITGQSQEWETSAGSLWLALGLSIFLVYVIMAAQFESLIYPFIILFTIPLALVGVVGVLLVLDMPLSIVVFLGAILLAGIVVNNAIVLVDYVGQLKSRGWATDEALALAGQVRLRPILMTTLTTVLGLVPMAMGLGDGAEIRMPMAITVIAGLSLSTLLTLIVIPTVYAGVDGIAARFSGRPPAQRLRDEVAKVQPEQLVPEGDRDLTD